MFKIDLNAPVDGKTQRRIAWVLFFILMAVYSYIFPRWADPNQNSRLDMVVAVVEDGTFQIDRYVDNTVDYARVGDHYYSDKAPGAAFLGIPVYASIRWFFDTPVFGSLVERLSQNAAFQQTLRADGSGILEDKVRFAIAQIVLSLALAAFPTALLGVFLYMLLGRWVASPFFRAGIVLAYGLLTPAFAYAQSFYGHQLSAALLVGALVLLLRENRQPRFWTWFGAGFLLGYSVITEFPAVLAAGCIALYGLADLLKRRNIQGAGWMILGGGIPVAAWMIYNTIIFGGPLSLGYSYSEQWMTQHHTGFMSLSMPTWEAAWGITFGSFRGLFVLSPLLLISLPGFVAWWQSRQDRGIFWVSLGCVTLTFLFNASSIMWWGGFAVGPRYLLPALPFMMLPIAFAGLRWGSTFWGKTLGFVGIVWSLAATWGMTLAEQAFPADTIRQPFLDFVLPNWRIGNIARNLGTVTGLPGLWSLVPLIGVLFFGLIVIWGLGHFQSGKLQKPQTNETLHSVLTTPKG